MIGKRAIAVIVASGVGLSAGTAAIYVAQQKDPFLRFDFSKDRPAEKAKPPSETAALEPEPAAKPKPKPETAGEVSSEGEPTAVPSFDVVVIQPSGEGVVAGRAAPGWQVSVLSGEAEVAAATVDEEGEWTAVLDKPLPEGDHMLSLKITSPDGTRALSSQERVTVDVGTATTPATVPPETTLSSAPSELKAAIAPTSAEQRASDVVVAAPRAATHAISPGIEPGTLASPAPKLVFKTVDYEVTGSSAGSVSMTGTSDPGATIKIYHDGKLLTTVRADRAGIWSVVAEKTLGTGEHNFRAEQINAATGEPSAQAMVAIERLVPKPPQVAAAESTASAQVKADHGQRAKDIYTVKRGDTLWAIAKRYFGSGLRYPAIFEDNRESIHDPDLIHPKQEVKVPVE
jgi:nucleoid-associated protein YgaU